MPYTHTTKLQNTNRNNHFKIFIHNHMLPVLNWLHMANNLHNPLPHTAGESYQINDRSSFKKNFAPKVYLVEPLLVQYDALHYTSFIFLLYVWFCSTVNSTTALCVTGHEYPFSLSAVWFYSYAIRNKKRTLKDFPHSYLLKYKLYGCRLLSWDLFFMDWGNSWSIFLS